MSTCFFIGHRDAPDSLSRPLADAVERHIVEYGVTEFVAGGYGRFDVLAARSVIEAKQRHPGVTLILLLPYHPQERPVSLPPGFDGTFYPPGMETVPRRAAIVRANRYMADHCSFLIAYTEHSASNAQAIAAHAQRRVQKGLLRLTKLVPEDRSPEKAIKKRPQSRPPVRCLYIPDSGIETGIKRIEVPAVQRILHALQGFSDAVRVEWGSGAADRLKNTNYMLLWQSSRWAKHGQDV